MSGIYIHIPFCKKACTYCNFHFSVSLKQKEAYLEALKKEIVITPKWVPDEPIETIYIGGGTPSLLTATELNDLLQVIKSNFSFTQQLEICLEANPDDISLESATNWRKLGINRLSVGIQSFDEAELVWMNRAHNAVESLNCIQLIRKAGFDNFSVDLIYGSPLQTDEILRRNLQTIFSLDVPHISAYALTVEPGTSLHHRISSNKQVPVNSDHQAAQFEILTAHMKNAGYEQYEISNFSKPGFRSRHNSSYWKGKAYYGFGAAAHAFDGNKIRRWNIANNSLYIQSLQKGLIPFEEEILTIAQQLNEYIMISLRTIEGMDLEVVERKYGKQRLDAILQQAQKYLAGNHLMQKNNRLILTDHGKFLADGIAAALFFE